ncbi:MAG: hypothetical protein AAFU85_05950 [Planctomycetota bacterium]
MGVDLWIALGFVAAISGLAFWAGRRLSLSVYRDRPFLFLECLALSLVFAFGVVGNLTWAHAFPTSAVICWSNWMPIFLAFTAGLATEMSALRERSRKFATVFFLMIAAGFLMLPVSRPYLSPIQLSDSDHWQDGVCLQSNSASCGPAAVATLLRLQGVLERTSRMARRDTGSQQESRSSEATFARLCLTSNEGTSTLGLFRGIEMGLQGTGMEARIADHSIRLWESKNQLPNVAVVQFEPVQSPGLIRGLLRNDGEKHAIVVHSRADDGTWLVADPAVGWRSWEDDALRAAFTGEAIYIGRK